MANKYPSASSVFRTYERTPKQRIKISAITSLDLPFEYENACRLCLEASDNMTDIFRETSDVISILEKIKYLLTIEVYDEDQFPRQICEKCLQNLSDLFLFKKRCIATQTKLRQCLYKLPPSQLTRDFSDCYSVDCEKQEKENCSLPFMSLEHLSSESRLNSADDIEEKQGDHNQLQTNRNLLEGWTFNIEVSTLDTETHSHESSKTNQTNEEQPTDLVGQTFCLENSTQLVEECRQHNSGPCKVTEKKDNIQTTGLSAKLEVDLRGCGEPSPMTSRFKSCLYCDKSFNTNSLLKRHLRVHTGDRPFQCDQCGKAFNQKEILARHTTLVHSQSKNYICRLCDRRFALLQSLRAHTQCTHSHDRLFVCEVCHSSFRHVSGLSRHRTIVHKGTRYKCKLCDVNYTDASSVRRHFLKYHIKK